MLGAGVLRKVKPHNNGGSLRARARKANLMMQGLRPAEKPARQSHR